MSWISIRNANNGLCWGLYIHKYIWICWFLYIHFWNGLFWHPSTHAYNRQQFCRGFSSSGVWHCVLVWVIPSVLKYHVFLAWTYSPLPIRDCAVHHSISFITLTVITITIPSEVNDEYILYQLSPCNRKGISISGVTLNENMYVIL